MNIWEKVKIGSTALSVVLIPIILAVVAQGYAQSLKERELEGKFVELAIDILRQAPSAESQSVRNWATNVVNEYSGVPLDDKVRADLIERLPLPNGVDQARFLKELRIRPISKDNKIYLGNAEISLEVLVYARGTKCYKRVRVGKNGDSDFFVTDQKVYELGSQLVGKSIAVSIQCEPKSIGPIDVKFIFRSGRDSILLGERRTIKGDPIINLEYTFTISALPI